jgi:small-conductance mechanosensitive channel
MSLDVFAPFTDWITANLNNIIFSVIMVVAGYIIYRLLSRQIRSLSYNERLEKHLALTLIRVVKWLSALIIFSAILAQWGVTLGTIMTIVTIFGGTIVGFAAVNTLGNAIAGLIVMTSRPFAVGDRIFFNGKFADVVAIDLIYTKMFTLDNVLVSVPNQELLKSEVDNYGKENVIRRRCTVTPGFEYDSAKVEKALLEAADKTPDVLKDPKPYVWITNFQNYAVEYSLYVFISEIKRLPEIDAELFRQVLEACKRHEIDISTPTLLKQIKS